MYEQRIQSNSDLPKAGQVLKLFTSDAAGELPFATMQARAFAILDPDRLARGADYITCDATFDEIAFQWNHVERMAQRFKRHLRPTVRVLDLDAARPNAPTLEALHFLKQAFNKDRSLSKLAQTVFPTRLVPVRDKRYLYQRSDTNRKQLIPDRYAFLVYRLIRNQLEAGDLFCPTSIRFRSFEDDLLSDQQWKHKDVLRAETALATLTQPIRQHSEELEQRLEAHIVAVNQRIAAGENEHFRVSGKGTRTRWTRYYPTVSEPVNHSVFATVPPLGISGLLHFVVDPCGFMNCFAHVLGR